jgi:hypothetical protein
MTSKPPRRAGTERHRCAWRKLFSLSLTPLPTRRGSRVGHDRGRGVEVEQHAPKVATANFRARHVRDMTYRVGLSHPAFGVCHRVSLSLPPEKLHIYLHNRPSRLLLSCQDVAPAPARATSTDRQAKQSPQARRYPRRYQVYSTLSNFRWFREYSQITPAETPSLLGLEATLHKYGHMIRSSPKVRCYTFSV